MNPKVRLPPVVPFTCQVTPVFVVPVTVAVNCSVAKFPRLATVGDTATVMFDGPAVVVIVNVADPDLVVSFCEMAVMVTCAGAGTVAGAVYRPVLDIVPFALPPATVQVTAVLNVSVTVAVICCAVPTTMFTPVGETLTDTTFPAVPLLHPARSDTTASNSSEFARFIRVPTNEGIYTLTDRGLRLCETRNDVT